MTLTVYTFTFNAFSENTYILADETRNCIIVDAGCYEKEEERELIDFIANQKLTPVALVNTHCHLDHIFGVDFLKNYYKIPYWIPEGELVINNGAMTMAQLWGFPKLRTPEPTAFLDKKKGISFGNTHLSILSVPGHSPDHVAFYHAPSKICLNGDVLFHRSIGRSDLPYGNQEQLIRSIRTVMYQLPDDTLVYCGHGNPTTIGEEKKHNPFVKG